MSEFKFPAVQYGSIGNDGSAGTGYVLIFESEQDAIENSEETFADDSALVAEYKLVSVRRLKVHTTTKVKEVKE